MDAHEVLMADHNRVRGLFKRFHAAEKGDDRATMGQLADKMAKELEIHTAIEEEIYYPAVSDLSEEVHDLVAEGLQEHHVAKELISELGAVERDSEQWVAKVKVLIEAIEHHAGEEETEMFPGVKRVMSDDDLTTLGNRLMDRKRQLGAPEPLIDLTKEELLAKARQQEIPGRSKMSRQELALTVDPRG
ncbi:MAG: hemerythrin domain-containing protein [Acidobacteria bacterium]|nr:hemerythrin domain-containing protein [Acidobacteriota bacterium]